MKTMVIFIITATFINAADSEQRCQSNTSSVLVTSSHFTLIEKRGNIALYERWVLHDSAIKARELKLVFSAKTDLHSVVCLLHDPARATRWNPHVSDFQIVKETNWQWLNYMRYNMPWPFTDQDCVLQYNLVTDSSSKWLVNFESSSHLRFPKPENATRLTDIRGQWLLEKRHDSIHIEYLVTTIPSKSLPRWVTDPIIRNNLLDTMTKFTNLLESINN